MKEKVLCPICNKLRSPYIMSSDLCQACYRNILSKYAYFKYKDEKIKPSTETYAYKICEMLVAEKINQKEVAKALNKSEMYVSKVAEQYLTKCDVNGNVKPDIERKF